MQLSTDEASSLGAFETVEFETTACLVCGSPRAKRHVALKDWSCDLPGDFTLVMCLDCGHIYQTPRPAQASLGLYYPDTYEPFWRAAGDHGWQGLRQRWGWRPRCRHAAHGRTGGRLLDVGCSTGIFLSEMRRYGTWEVHGVETNAFAAGYARKQFGLDVFVGQVQAAPWPAHSFDVVTLWDVLEHLPDPRAALARIRTLLADNGTLLCSVPNAGGLDARLFGRYWIGLDAPRHMSVFTPASLRRLLADTGFEIESAFCFYGRYTTFALSVRQWLHARWPDTPQRRAVERLIFLPVWRYLTLPTFWLVDQWRRGAILTVRCRPKEQF
jgi:SAM-dependent methyltransferase